MLSEIYYYLPESGAGREDGEAAVLTAVMIKIMRGATGGGDMSLLFHILEGTCPFKKRRLLFFSEY